MEEEVVFRGQAVTIPLCYETRRETFIEVTSDFYDKLTVRPDPVPLDLPGSNECNNN